MPSIKYDLLNTFKTNPKAFEAELEEVKKLSKVEQARIFQQIDNAGWNVIMVATFTNLAAVGPLLEVIAELELKDRAVIFKQLDLWGYNFLMLVVRNNISTVIGPILKVIEGLEQNDQAAIFTQVIAFPEVWNVLMIAVYYSPALAGLLLDVIERLDQEHQAVIFTQVNAQGWNAVMLAARKNPELVAPLITAIFSLECMTGEQKLRFIETSLKDSDFNAKDFPEVCMQYMSDLLDSLRPAASTNELYVLNPDSPQMKLWKSLNDDWEKYSVSNKGSYELRHFQASWNKKINAARENIAIKERPDIMSVLQTMLLFLSVIGIVYLAYQAGKNMEKNRSMFFQSKNEKALNSLQDLTNSMPNKENETKGMQEERKGDFSPLIPLDAPPSYSR